MRTVSLHKQHLLNMQIYIVIFQLDLLIKLLRKLAILDGPPVLKGLRTAKIIRFPSNAVRFSKLAMQCGPINE